MQRNGTFRTIVIFPAIGLIIGILVTFMFLESILRFLPVNDGLYTAPVDEESPYPRFEPNRQVTWSKGWNFHMTNKNKVNNAGFVNDVDYDKAAETPLISVIGDSYVEALMVPHPETLQGLLASKVGKAARVYSFARSGAPLSQYLNYAQLATKEFSSDFLIFIIVSNDFDESLEIYKKSPASYYFYGEPGVTSLELRRVNYQPRWHNKLIRHSSLAKYLLANVKLKHILTQIRSPQKKYVSNVPQVVEPTKLKHSQIAVDTFFNLLPQLSSLDPSKILFIFDGLREQIYSDQKELYSGSFFKIMRDYFILSAQQNGYEIIDMNRIFSNDFKENRTRFEFKRDWHWNPYAHSLVASAALGSRNLQRILFRLNGLDFGFE